MTYQAYGAPDGIRWIVLFINQPITHAIRRLGPSRVRWRGTPHHYNHDSAWLLDGKPATIAQIHEAAGHA